MTKDEYEAVGLPVVQEEVGMFKLSYRNRSLPASFVGNGRDESPVASAMKKYRAEAVRFAGQVMLATGYFNTRLPTEQPKTEINYTELRLSYSNGIVFHFVADRSRDGVCGCYLQRITLDGKQIYNGCFSRCSGFFIQSGFFPFYSTIVSPSFPYLVSVTPSPVGFFHAKVQQSSGVKHHCANGSWICPAAFRKSKMAFQPPPRTSAGWVFREIPRPFACLSVLSPLSGLHVNLSRQGSRKAPKAGRRKKQVQQLKI